MVLTHTQPYEMNLTKFNKVYMVLYLILMLHGINTAIDKVLEC